MSKEAIGHRERLKVLENTMGTTYYEIGHLHLAISDAMEEYHQAKLKLLGIADVVVPKGTLCDNKEICAKAESGLSRCDEQCDMCNI